MGSCREKQLKVSQHAGECQTPQLTKYDPGSRTRVCTRAFHYARANLYTTGRKQGQRQEEADAPAR